MEKSRRVEQAELLLPHDAEATLPVAPNLAMATPSAA